jgi:predicted Rossmann fold flavoprotein
MQEFDVVILGGGAAGLLCAIEAGKRGRSVVVLERSERVGKKILISGGGRCNFTNLYCSPENFISRNEDFCRSALARFTPADFVGLVERHGIAYHEKRPYQGAAAGQLFCDRSAEDIVAMLVQECAAAGVRILVGVGVTKMRRQGGGFVVRARIDRASEVNERTEDREFVTRALVVATGGLSIPKVGATAFGYEVARQFGHAIVETRPGLVPLTFGGGDARAFCDLAGVSAVVEASCGGRSFREKMLLTHRGLSGPAILQVSSYWGPGEAVRIDLAPEVEWTAQMRNGAGRRDAAAARTALGKILPQRLADRWMETAIARSKPADWTNVGLAAAEAKLHGWQVRPAATEGYVKAEVTVGGVDTAELSSKTMESRLVPGLYFVGEVVDVTGWLGGFNFQWAWASGVAAGRAV